MYSATVTVIWEESATHNNYDRILVNVFYKYNNQHVMILTALDCAIVAAEA